MVETCREEWNVYATLAKITDGSLKKVKIAGDFVIWIWKHIFKNNEEAEK